MPSANSMRSSGVARSLSVDLHANYLASRRLPSLDGLRAFAILAVLWHHATPAAVDAAQIRFFERGFLGVDLFFVLSGYLIVTLLLRERDRNAGAIDLKAFYLRRTLRIVPLQYATTLAILMLARGESAAAVRHDVPYALTYTSNFVAMQSMLAITWSLAAEEQFYLVWPWIEAKLRRWLPLVLGATMATSVGVSWGIQYAGLLPEAPAFFGATTFLPILLGVLLAHVMHTPRGFAALAPVCAPRGSIMVALLAALLAIAVLPRPLAGAPQALVQILFTWLVACAVYRPDHALRPLLQQWWLLRIGVVSYGMYLMHHPCRHVAVLLFGESGVGTNWSVLLAMVLSTWLVAELSFHTFERFFMRWKERYTR